MANVHNIPLSTKYNNLRNVPVPMQALVEAGLSPNQWVCMFLLHFEMWRELAAFQTGPDSPQGFPEEELRDLYERFYLIHEPVPGDHPKESPANFRVSERFTDLLVTVKAAYIPLSVQQDAFKRRSAQPFAVKVPAAPAATAVPVVVTAEQLEDFDSLFQAYPSHIPVNGKLMSGRSGDYDNMANQYASLLAREGSPGHAHILELVAWAKEKSLLNMGLQKFLNSREWLGLHELRASGHQGTTYYDSSESI